MKRRERTEKRFGRKVIPRGSRTDEERKELRRATVKRYWLAHKEEIKKKPYYGRALRKQTFTLEQRCWKNEWQKMWRKANPDKVRAYAKSYETPQRIIRQRLASRIVKCLKRKKVRKCEHTIELIGCTWDFLKSYLESKFLEGMSWEKRSLWHIDHIRPCASFDLTDPIQQKMCFHYTNLQPLWAMDNMKKHAKWQEAA